MFRSFGLRENPFHVSPDPRFMFSGRAYETALAELMFGIESHRGLLVLTGEAGTGKTTLMRQFLQWLKDRQFSSSYIFHTHLHSAEMFEFILQDFGVAADSSKKIDLLATLHRWLHARQSEGDSPVIVIDEAQALSLRTLSELNLLLNLENAHGKLVQIVLAGQPELEEKLRRPELRALRQRIMVRCRLPLLSLEETGEYIAARLRGAGGSGEQTFPPETVQTVYAFARGIPRIINLLCEQALVGAYADRHTAVSPGNVHRVASEFDLAGPPASAPSFDLFFVAPPKKPVSSEAPAAGTGAASEFLPAREIPRASPPAARNLPIPQVSETPASPVALSQSKPAEIRVSPSVRAAEEAAATEFVPNTAAASGFAPAIGEIPKPPASPPHGPDLAPPLDPPAGDPQPSREYGWRKHRSPGPLGLYWREVAESFARDWSRFFASFAPQANAFAGSVPVRAESFRRKVIEPLGNWLRKPVNLKRRSGETPGPSAGRGR